MRALFASLLTPPLLLAFALLGGIDLLDRDPCEGMKRGPCVDRENAGDRWSRDQRDRAALQTVAPADAESILDQVDLPKDPIRIAEVTPNGNLVVAGRAELLVIFCDEDKVAYVADLAGGFSFARGSEPGADPDEIASAVGVRCSATLLANKDRPVGGAFHGCRTFVCFGNDALYRAFNPEE